MNKYTAHRVTVYLGVIGVGKSTYGVKIAQMAFKAGVKVYTNMPDIAGAYKISLSDLMKYDISNGVVIWDEMGIEANNREFKSFPRGAREWFKLARHYKCAVHVFSQALDFDVTIPRITSEIYTMRKGLIFPVTWLVKWNQVRDTDQQTGYPRWIWEPTRFPRRMCWRPRYYKYFNSWQAPQLPALPEDRLIPYPENTIV